MSRTDTVPAQCTDCGACCFSDSDRYIEVFAVDVARLDVRALGLTLELGGRRFMRWQADRCSALEVDSVGYRCTIYQMRPDACRWLEHGSGACREQITQKREIALLALRRSRDGAPL